MYMACIVILGQLSAVINKMKGHVAHFMYLNVLLKEQKLTIELLYKEKLKYNINTYDLFLKPLTLSIILLVVPCLITDLIVIRYLYWAPIPRAYHLIKFLFDNELKAFVTYLLIAALGDFDLTQMKVLFEAFVSLTGPLTLLLVSLFASSFIFVLLFFFLLSLNSLYFPLLLLFGQSISFFYFILIIVNINKFFTRN